MIRKLGFVDSYGNKTTDVACRITMSADEFSKFTWENLDGLPVYHQMKESADEFYVDPVILAEVDPDAINLHY